MNQGPQGASGSGGGLTQEQLERAERNRLAALERRRQSAAHAAPSSAPPPAGWHAQPPPQQQPPAYSQPGQRSTQPAAPASNSALRAIFMPSPATAAQPLHSGPQPGCGSSSGQSDLRLPPQHGNGGWDGTSGPGHAFGGSLGGPVAPQHLSTQIDAGWQQGPQQPPQPRMQQAPWPAANPVPATCQPQAQLQLQPGQDYGGAGVGGAQKLGHLRGFVFSQPAGLGQLQAAGGAAGATAVPPQRPTEHPPPPHQPLGPSNWSLPGQPQQLSAAFAVKKVHVNSWGQAPASRLAPGGSSGLGSSGQAVQQQQSAGGACAVPQARQPGPQQPHAVQRQEKREQHGRYGSNTTFSFTSSRGPGGGGGDGGPKPGKQLQQATIAGTLSKWRKSKQEAAESDASSTAPRAAPAAAAAGVSTAAPAHPVGWQGQGAEAWQAQPPQQMQAQPQMQLPQQQLPMQAGPAASSLYQQPPPAPGLCPAPQPWLQQPARQQPARQQPARQQAVSPREADFDDMAELLAGFTDDDDDDWIMPAQHAQQAQHALQSAPQPAPSQQQAAQPAGSALPPRHPQAGAPSQAPMAQQQPWEQPAWRAGPPHMQATPSHQQGWVQSSHRDQSVPSQHAGGAIQSQQAWAAPTGGPAGSASKWAPARSLPTPTQRPPPGPHGTGWSPPAAASGFRQHAATPSAGPGLQHHHTTAPPQARAWGLQAGQAQQLPAAAPGMPLGQGPGGCMSRGPPFKGAQSLGRPPASSTPSPGGSGWASKSTPQQLTAEQRQAKARRVLAPPAAMEEAEDRERWPWLKERRDAEGRAPDDPAFDHTTILIPQHQFPRRPFDKQYWSIKRKHMDLVLFVRVGSFYELYDTDADIGIRVGLAHMAGSPPANMWKVGTSCKAFQEWAAKVLALGYNVGRVEECAGRNADKIVNRKLVQVYTPGTVLDGPMLDGAGGSQPLVALVEGPNGALGACVADVSLCTLSLSQWQEVDAGRSMLGTLLLQANPAEVVVMRGGQVSRDTARLLRAHRPLSADGTERMLTISQLHDFTLLHDLDSPDGIAALVQHTEDLFFHHRGSAEAWHQGMPERLVSEPLAAVALQMAVHHLMAAEVAQRVMPHARFQPIAAFTSDGARASGHMLLDSCAIQTLELVEGSLGTPEGSLLRFLDQAVTPAGHRKVRTWLCSPLYRVADVSERLDMVQAFMNFPDAAAAFRAGLRCGVDCERLLPKVADKLAGVLERAVQAVDAQEEAQAGAGEQCQHEAPGGSKWEQPTAAGPGGSRWGAQPAAAGTSPGGEGGAEVFEAAASVMDLRQGAFLPVVQLFEGVGKLLQAVKALEASLAFGRGSAAGLPPLARALGTGGAVALALQTLLAVFDAGRFSDPEADISLDQGVSPEYDAARAEIERLQAAVEQLVAAQQAALLRRGEPAAVTRKVRLVELGEETLLEVPIGLKQHLRAFALVKETKTVARFRVPEIVQALAALTAARTEARALVLDSMAQSAQLFLDSCPAFQSFVSDVAALDALSGFALATHPAAAPPGCAFCRPFAAPAGTGGLPPPLHLEDLWNPQLLFSTATHVQPNTLQLGGAAGSAALLLTGANTGGKSTLLRATCLAVVMAQLGCYVPCSRAELAPVDRIFTRIGAQDRIMSGESTFLVEMTETSSLLQHAQPSSLVVLDELGRGTSTFDGYAIACAVLHHLAAETGCRTLFATHYHGLNHEPELQPIVQRAHMATAVQEGTFVPLFQLREGPAPEGSCGIEVAAACGMPPALIARAAQRAAWIERDIMRKQACARAQLGKRKASGGGSAAGEAAEAAGSVEMLQLAAAARQVLSALARDAAGEPGALQAAVQLTRQLRAVLGEGPMV